MGTFSFSDLIRRGAQAVRSIAKGIGAGYSGAPSGGSGGAYGLGYRLGSGARAGAKMAAAAVEVVKPTTILKAVSSSTQVKTLRDMTSQYQLPASISIIRDCWTCKASNSSLASTRIVTEQEMCGWSASMRYRASKQFGSYGEATDISGQSVLFQHRDYPKEMDNTNTAALAFLGDTLSIMIAPESTPFLPSVDAYSNFRNNEYYYTKDPHPYPVDCGQ